METIFIILLLANFFPNALYIVTDLTHLQSASVVPKWFDVILLFSSAIMGLVLAFASLLRIEIFLSNFFKNKIVDIMILAILFAGSFGVYLGRFLRWNSWDIISNPIDLLLSVSNRIGSPLEHPRTWAMTFILTGLFYLMYMIIKKLPKYIRQANYV